MELLAVLKESAEKFKPQIIGNAREEIRKTLPGYLPLFDRVFRDFYLGTDSGGRWYDPYHVAYSTLFAVKLVKNGEASPLVVPAVILHDIGYHSQFVDKVNWSSKNSRIIHMQEGAGMAAKILSVGGRFSASEIGAIVGMVASHDNGYLGIAEANADRLAVRDADRIWVMHPLSFYKDWLSKKAKGEDLSPLDLFQSRLTSFYGPLEPYPRKWGKTENSDKEDAVQLPPFTKLAKKWRDRQFMARFCEIQDTITLDAETFRKAIEKHIRAELEVGRG